MKRPFLKKLDIVIMILLLMAAAASFCLLSASAGSDAQVKITKNGELVGIYPLDEDNYIVIDAHNSVCIQDGKVWMDHSDCPDGYCLKMGKISRGSIICLPNRVVVEIISADAPDAIAGAMMALSNASWRLQSVNPLARASNLA